MPLASNLFRRYYDAEWKLLNVQISPRRPAAPPPRRPAAPPPRRPAVMTTMVLRRCLGSIIAVSLGLMLMYAAAHKAIDPTSAHNLIEATLPSAPARSMVRMSISAEWILGLILITGFRQRAAFLALLCLIAMFSGVLYRAKLAGFTGSCGCLGLDQSASSALVRNAILAGAGLIGYSLSEARVRSVSPFSKRNDA